MRCPLYCHVVVIGLPVTQNFALVNGSDTPGEQRLFLPNPLPSAPLLFHRPLPASNRKVRHALETTKLGYAAFSLGRAGP